MVKVFVFEESPGLSDRLLERLRVIPELTVVGIARNLLDAVRQITTKSPDVVITDPELAEGGGLALLHMLHQRREAKGIGPRVLLWTGDRDPRRWAIAQGLGAEARFDKAREVDLLVERCRGAASENG